VRCANSRHRRARHSLRDVARRQRYGLGSPDPDSEAKLEAVTPSAPELPGKPDIILRKARIVVFVDGDFWHGRHWKQRRAKLARGSNAAYWIPKIEANIARDRRVTRALRKDGWIVLRFWETDLLDSVETAVTLIAQAARNNQLART